MLAKPKQDTSRSIQGVLCLC